MVITNMAAAQTIPLTFEDDTVAFAQKIAGFLVLAGVFVLIFKALSPSRGQGMTGGGGGGGMKIAAWIFAVIMLLDLNLTVRFGNFLLSALDSISSSLQGSGIF